MAIFRVAATLAAVVCCAAGPSPTSLRGSPDEVSREVVVDRLRSILGHGSNTARLDGIKDLLRVPFAAVHKGPRGGLDHRTTRYLLYRYFLVHHGWYIKGLALEVNEAEHSIGAPTVLLKARMPSLIMNVLEEHIGSAPVGLEELAVLAATIEDLVHGDAHDVLRLAYSTHGFAVDSELSDADADLLLKTFTMYFVMPSTQNQAGDRMKIMHILDKRIQASYPGWEDVLLWLGDLRHVAEDHDRHANPFNVAKEWRWNFVALARIATQITGGFGRLSELECQQMKNNLIDLDEQEGESGRVRLHKFYQPYLEGSSFHFSESPDYLRHLGALDERSRQPSVIVTNVMYSRSNCLSNSGFHSVCCIDECEVVMTRIEEQVANPTAEPRKLAAVVANVPSSNVAAPRNLSATLLTRLEAIAERHGGEIPLHSRLFAEWLHFAFPNECPYPRSLLTREEQLSPKEWSRKAERKVGATRDEAEELVQMGVELEQEKTGRIGEGESGADGSEILWSEDEELLSEDLHTSLKSRGWFSSARPVMRAVAGAAVLVATASGITNAWHTYRTPEGLPLSKAHMV